MPCRGILAVQNEPDPAVRRGASCIGARRTDRSGGVGMIIAENGFSPFPLLPLGGDQCWGVNLEMPAGIIRDILRHPIAAHPAIATKENSADFLGRASKGN